MTVLLVILAILILLLLLPVGVSGSYDFGDVTLKVVAGPLHLQLLPKKEKKKDKPKKQKVPKAKKDKPKKKMPALTPETLVDYLRLGTGTLNRFRRKLTIDHLKFWYLAAAEDPCDAALAYGRANAVAAQVLALLHCAFNIREQDVRLRVDFTETKSQFALGGELTIRVGQALAIALLALIDFLKILIKQRKRTKLQSERNDENGQASHRRDDGNNNVEDQGNGGREYHRGYADHNA